MTSTPSEPTSSRALRFEGLLWAALACAVRIALLLSLCDVFGYGEELEKACAGKALRDGIELARHELPYHPYEGGGFVVSHLDALAFSLVGESVLAIKLVALGFLVAILLAGWSLCERFAGRNAARAFALLYVFAPESVQANSLLALGIHYHANLFVALILLLALRIALEGDRAPRRWLALGVACGFGFYFSYQCALTIAVALAAIAFTLRRRALAPAGWFALGAALGLAPFLAMAIHVGSEVFDIHGAGLVASFAKKPEQLRLFCASLFTDRPWWDALALVALAAAPIAAALALRKIEARPARFALGAVLAHALLFLVAYLASGFTVGKVLHYFYLHRLTPLWFLAALAVALAFGASNGRWRKLLAGAVAVLALSGAFDTLRLVRDASPGSWSEHAALLAHAKGYRYSQYLQKIAPRIDRARPEKLALFLRFDERDPEMLHEALGTALYGEGRGSLEDNCAEIRAAGVSDLRGFLLGFGLMLMRHHVSQVGDSPEARADFRARVAKLAGFEAAVRDPLVEGIGRFGTWELRPEEVVLDEVRQALAQDLPEALFVGFGHRLVRAGGGSVAVPYFRRRRAPLWIDHERTTEKLDALPERARPALARGVEAEFALTSLD